MKFSFRTILAALTLTFLCGLTALARDPVPVAIPATPDGTLKAIGAAMGEGKLEVVWQSLPASYQADIKKVLTELSKKVDAELWAEGTKVLGKVAKMMADKSDYIVGTPLVAQQLQGKPFKPADLAKYLAGFGSILGDVQSNIATLPQVGTLDVEKLLANMGPRAKELGELAGPLGLQKPGENLADLHKVDVKLVNSNTDSATVELIKPDGTKESVELVKVEGKWVYKAMADQWAGKVAEILKGIEGMQVSPDQKQQVMVGLAMGNNLLDQFLNAKTQAEFDTAVNGVLPLVQAAMMNQRQAAPAPQFQPQPQLPRELKPLP